VAFREALVGEDDRQASDDSPLGAEYGDCDAHDAGIEYVALPQPAELVTT